MPNFLKHLAISAIRIRRRGFLFLLPVLFIGLLLPLHFVSAASVLGFGVNVEALISAAAQIAAPFVILGAIAAIIPPLGGWVLEQVLTWSIPYTHCAPPLETDCFIETVWQFIRDIGNMGIIIALVVIALGTIMNWQGYRLREAFPKLILVALLINFSRVFVAIPVDIANALMSVFVAELPSMSNIGEAMSISPPGLSQFLTPNIGKIIGNLIAIPVIGIFQIILGIVLLLYGVIFLIRYIVIWILTILSPLALAAYILPHTRKAVFDKWLKQLISWAFMGPIMLFYLWLVMLFGKQSGIISPQNLPEGDILSSLLETLWRPIVLLLFLIVAFILAISSNSIGSRLAIRYGRRWGNKAWGGIKSGARRWSRRQFARPGAKAGREIAGRLGRVPLVGGAFRGMGRALMRYGERERARPRAEQQNYKGMAYGDLRTILQTETKPNKLIGAYLEAVEKHSGNLEKDLREDPRIKSKFQGMLKHAQFRDLHGNFLKKFPQHASAIGASPGDFVRKLNRQDIQNLSADALKGKDVASALLENQAFSQETLRGLANNPEKLRALDSSLRAYLADKNLNTKEERMDFFRNPQNYGVAPEHQVRIRAMGSGKKNIESDPHLSAMRFLETSPEEIEAERRRKEEKYQEEEARKRAEEAREMAEEAGPKVTGEERLEAKREIAEAPPPTRGLRERAARGARKITGVPAERRKRREEEREMAEEARPKVTGEERLEAKRGAEEESPPLPSRYYELQREVAEDQRRIEALETKPLKSAEDLTSIRTLQRKIRESQEEMLNIERK